MKVALIKEYSESFKEALIKEKFYPDLHLNDLVANWQLQMNLESVNLAENFDKSLDSHISHALWGGSRHSAKSLMKLMIQTDKEFMRSGFRDLFNEQKDLALRINRFKDHCDEIFNLIRDKDKLYNSHFHDDKKYPLIYLACTYPESYCFWDYPLFEKMMENLGALNTPSEIETERCYKSMRAIFGIIQKDEVTLSVYQNHLRKNKVNDAINLIFMNHFSAYTALKK